MMVMTKQNFVQFLEKGTVFSLDHDRLLIGWGERNWSGSPQESEKPDFYFPDFFLKVNMPWFTHEHWMIISIDELSKWLPEKTNLEITDWKLEKQPFFESKFIELETKFNEGELVKAVPYLFLETKTTMNSDNLQSRLSYLIDYIQKCPTYLYGLWDEEEGILGATPEILFDQKDQDGFETVACAGTYETAKDQSVSCQKLNHEHETVIEGIKESLMPFGTVKTADLKTISFGSLTHLITPIEVKLNQEMTFEKIVRTLHPTPALGAFPKDKGMIFLEKYQMGIPRGRFGSPVGFSFQNVSRCFIAIRNIQWNKKGIQMGAGCGVCSGSILGDELKEINLKLNAIKTLLGLCNC